MPAYVPDPSLEATLSAYQLMIQDRLDEGIRGIQHAANSLMHEIASEVWRTAGGDKDEVQARILETLSRDQALRGLISHSDERFQALAVNTARLEDTLNHLAEQTRSAREALERGADALAEAAGAPGVRDVEEIRERFDLVTRQIALAFETLAERDRAIVETVQARVSEHGEVVTSETGRIAEAMQAYVQEGVSAVGNLAGRVESHMEQMVVREDDISASINQTVEQQMRLLAEQLQLMYERMTVDTVSLNEAITHQSDQNDQRIEYLSEHLQLMHDRIGMETRDTIDRLEGLEARTIERLAAGISLSDDALSAQSESIREVLGSAAERTEQAISSATAAAERTEQAVAVSAERTEQAVAVSAERTEQAIARSGSVMELTGHFINQAAQAIEQTRQALDERAGYIEEATRQAAIDMGREVNRTIEEGVTGLAKLVRSDSEAVRSELVRSASERDEAMGLVLDEQLGRISEALTAATRWTVEEMTRRVHDETTHALQGRLDEAVASIGSVSERNSQLIGEHLNDTVSAIDRNMNLMTNTLNTELDRLARNVGERAAVAVHEASEGKFDQTMQMMATTTSALERIGADLTAARRATEEQLDSARRATEEQLASAQRATEEQLVNNIDQKIAGLARMIRSDNQALAERLVVAADQEASKQALRAVKELQAQLPSEVTNIVERRVQEIAEQLHRDTQATAESVAKQSEMLAEKMERMVVRIGQRQESESQIVIDRMSEAMDALASLGRPATRPERIELE